MDSLCSSVRRKPRKVKIHVAGLERRGGELIGLDVAQGRDGKASVLESKI